MYTEAYYCKNKCCKIHTTFYKGKNKGFNSNYKKAGVLIYDPKTDRILLVQSRGNLWGPPKGTMKKAETFMDCAIREVKEETGLSIKLTDKTMKVNVKNRAIYYYVEMDYRDINVQSQHDDNDANGITWIKLSCLKDIIYNGDIYLNHYCKIVIKYFLGVNFLKSKWKLVKK